MKILSIRSKVSLSSIFKVNTEDKRNVRNDGKIMKKRGGERWRDGGEARDIDKGS